MARDPRTGRFTTSGALVPPGDTLAYANVSDPSGDPLGEHNAPGAHDFYTDDYTDVDHLHEPPADPRLVRGRTATNANGVQDVPVYNLPDRTDPRVGRMVIAAQGDPFLSALTGTEDGEDHLRPMDRSGPGNRRWLPSQGQRDDTEAV